MSLQEPAFFSWLSVTQYLSGAAVFSTLSCIAENAAAGSSIVFEYILEDHLLNKTDRELREWYGKGAAAMGEPWLSRFDPHGLESRLRRLGFSAVTHFSKTEAVERYLRGREDGLTVPGYAQLITAAM